MKISKHSIKLSNVCAHLILTFMILIISISNASADLITDYETTFDETSQNIHVVLSVEGGNEGGSASEYPKDIIVLMDNSLSMQDEYTNKPRLEWTQDAIINFAQSIHSYNSRIGVVTFSDSTSVLTRPTLNYETVKSEVEKITPQGFSSNIGDGIQRSSLVFKENKRDAMPILIVLTDGGSVSGVSIDETVNIAKEEGIIVYVLSFGDQSTIDSVALRNLASETGGSYKHSSFDGLSESMQNIIEMDEFLSAVNVDIEIQQSDDAIMDYYSVEPMVSKDVKLTQKSNVDFISPKLLPGEKIELEFDVFSSNKGEVDSSTIVINFVDQEGKINSLDVLPTENIPTQRPWETYTKILFVVVIISLLGIILVKIKNVPKSDLEKEKRRMNEKLNRINFLFLSLKDEVESEFDKYNKFTSNEIEDLFKNISDNLSRRH